jgi:fimbrial isopeptide formation D2 family protein/LPXTG-motif cell wall-anchored protein
LGAPITWADNTKGDSLLTALKADSETKLINSTTGKNYFAEATSAEDVANALSSLGSEATNRFAQLADGVFGTENGTSSAEVAQGDTTATITGLTKGYYLIKDTTSDSSADKTRLIMNVASAETVTLKVDTTTLEKKVALTEDGEYIKGKKAEIGQKVYFELIAHIPAAVEDYKSYQLVFHDKLPAGLTYNKIEAVYMTTTASTNNHGQNIATSDYTYRSTSTQSGYSFDVAIGDLIGNATYYNYLKQDDNTIVVVKYSAYLNDDAITTSAGNLNTAKLSYTNDPSSNAITDLTTNDPGGKTPEEYAKVFTYKLAGTKVDASDANTKLQGAEFVIYKKVEGVDKYLTEDYLDSENQALGKDLVWTATSAADAKVFTSGADGTFTITGLSEGVYYLKETKAPEVDGKVYSLLAKDLEIHVEATVSDVTNVGDDRTNVAQTTALTAKEKSNGEVALTIDEDKTTISIDVQNGAGNSLPTTGGMGTTIFYILGAILVVGSAVLLIVRKRMSVER